MPYIPHTAEETELMLKSIGAADIEALFDEIPQHLKYDGLKKIPESMNEMELLQHAQKLANANQQRLCFLGAGAYHHHIPAAVWDIASRGEFLTAYTPYQAEASQGTLQLLYEFQTMICSLTGMDVANASLYDGATALAEAVLMAVRLNKHSKSNRILVPLSLHPLYRETVETIVRNQHIELITLPYDEKTGTTSLDALKAYDSEDITALVIPQPNFFGCLEEVDILTDWAEAHQAISIACVNPVSLALLKAPGDWGQKGVDICCGEGQPLGSPLASGGPYFGFFSTRMAHVRQMPGRLIGRTVDKDGKTGYTLTLQAREQHIRRDKAKSNICTNQGLLVTAATIHMALLGPEGLKHTAITCHQKAHFLQKNLAQIEGVEVVFSSPYFHEWVLRFNKPVDEVLKELDKAGITGGYSLKEHYPELGEALLICTTEMNSEHDMAKYTEALTGIMSQGRML